MRPEMPKLLEDIRAAVAYILDKTDGKTLDQYLADDLLRPAVERYFEIVMRSLTFRDSWLTVAKGITFGAVIGVVPLYQGLAAGGASTDVPVASSRAVVGSIVAIFLLSVLFVAVSL